MLKVAAAALGADPGGAIPGSFMDATHLLIIDADTGEVLEVVENGGLDPYARSLYLVRKTAEHDCEALLCGELEQEAFAILAEENCITRYDAAGISVNDSIRLMNEHALGLITDFIGGAGCPDADPANCANHEDL